MTEARYNIERDLSEAKTMADNLLPYVYENELYGNIGGGSTPKLTIGGLLLRLHRLHTLADRLNANQKATLERIDAQHEEVRREWSIHYHEKLKQEAFSRLKVIEAFFVECEDDPRACSNNYQPEANRRTIVQNIVEALGSSDGSADVAQAAKKIDARLRRFTEPSDFVWSSELQPAYPPDKYWWLYAKPPRFPSKG